MANGNFTTTTHDQFLPEIWADSVIEYAKGALVMAPLVTDFSALAAARGGDAIKIPTTSALTVQNKSVNTAMTPQVNTDSPITLSLNTHKAIAIRIEDRTLVQAQQNYDLMGIYTREAGYEIAKAIDDALLGLYSGLSQSVDSGSAITEAKIIEALTYLDEAKAPDMDRFMVVGPSAKGDILQLAKFTSRDYVSGNPAENGRLGDIFGARVFHSPGCVKTTAGSPVVTTQHNLVFQRGAFGLAIQAGPRVEMQYSALDLAYEIVVHVIFGVVELRDTFAVDLFIDV